MSKNRELVVNKLTRFSEDKFVSFRGLTNRSHETRNIYYVPFQDNKLNYNGFVNYFSKAKKRLNYEDTEEQCTMIAMMNSFNPDPFVE